MHFIDQTEIRISSGNGGNGIVSFRAARNKPKLGPDGGSGGHGGNAYFIADNGLNTLATLRYRREYRAEDGGRGGSNNLTGRTGEDLYVKVPPGTQVYDHESGECLGEAIDPTKPLLIAEGGKRGFGNLVFVSSTHRSPRMCTEGKKGITKHVRLELKVLADIGLAGAPNAGKSTLLSCVSQARPKIANYPFTTLHPVLGVVEVSNVDGSSFVMADIPGLIEGASQGRGLGFEFLRHLERTKIIAYVLDCSLEPELVLKNFLDLKKELFTYNSAFEAKQGVIVLNKIDLLNESELSERTKLFEHTGLPIVPISAATNQGIKTLVFQLAQCLEKAKDHDASLLEP